LPGRDNSFGRKRRDVEDDTDLDFDWDADDIYRDRRDVVEEGEAANSNSNKVEIKEMFRVYESREIIPQGSVCKNETTKVFYLVHLFCFVYFLECVGHSFAYVTHFVHIFERCLDSNPESCLSKQALYHIYHLSHPSPY
jgi:hypothetical protein